MMRGVGSLQFGFSGFVSLAFVLSLLSQPRSVQAQTPEAATSVDAQPAPDVASDLPLSLSLSGEAGEGESEGDWDLAHRRYASWYGPTGGMFLFDGRSAQPGAVRIQFGLDGFVGSDYLQQGDHVSLSDQVLALNVTALKNLEFYGTLSNRAVNQSRPDERTLDVLGDLSIGGRIGAPLGRLLDIGADVRATFTNGINGGGFDWGATSVGLRGALSLDLQKLKDPWPLLVRFNVGYVLDNSAVVVEDTENARYAGLSNRKPKSDETNHLISRLERFAQNVNRLDRLAIGAGVEFPLRVADKFYLHPALEWQMAVPVNRQRFDCPNVLGQDNVGTTEGTDGCYERLSSALPMNLAVGLRVVPPVRGLSGLFAFEFGLTGTDRFVRELTPNLPWRFLIGLSYDYDARPAVAPAPAPAAIAEAPPATPVPVVAAAPRGRVLGRVSTVDQKPIADAHVRFLDLKLSTLLTDEQGQFTTEPLPPGAVALEISHPDFDTSRCVGNVPPQGSDVTLMCTLTVQPVVAKVQGQVVDPAGELLGPARIILSGPKTALLMTEARGQFTLDELPVGNYVLRVESGAYFIRQMVFTVSKRDVVSVNLELTRKPLAPTISFAGDRIEAPALVYPNDSTTQLSAAALQSVAELADLLLTRPDLYVELRGYAPTEEVGRNRALLIKQKLVEAGVPDSHIQAIGGGLVKFRILLHR